MGNIAVRKRTAPSPTWTRETFDQLLANAPDPVVVMDEARRILLFNLAAEALFGRSASEVLSQPLDILTSVPLTETDLEAGELEFIVNTVPDLPEIDVDPRRIEQVLSNLLRNAMKFTPGGGRVVLSALPEGGHSGGVRFAVSDTGPGIPAEDLGHIFDWFWRSPQGGRSGTGLGLAIAKGLIEAHGGDLRECQ